MNFFNWIREGVRQAVLCGVSDAVGDIGVPPDGEDPRQRLLEVIRTTADQPPAQLAVPLKRKRLGRSLAEIHQAGSEKAQFEPEAVTRPS